MHPLGVRGAGSLGRQWRGTDTAHHHLPGAVSFSPSKTCRASHGSSLRSNITARRQQTPPQSPQQDEPQKTSEETLQKSSVSFNNLKKKQIQKNSSIKYIAN